VLIAALLALEQIHTAVLIREALEVKRCARGSERGGEEGRVFHVRVMSVIKRFQCVERLREERFRERDLRESQ
jgi:hypothetical protein